MVKVTTNQQSSIRLIDFIDPNHRIVILADSIDWQGLEKAFPELTTYCFGRPKLHPRLVLGLMMIQYLFDLSDRGVIERWVENPYYQYFCGCEYFENEVPMHHSGLSKWRGRLHKNGVSKILAETIRVGEKTKAVRKNSFKQVIFDTTVQPKNITHPTDSKLYHRTITQVARLAKGNNVKLKQTFKKASKQALVMAGRYLHARQSKRARVQIKKLKVMSGRILRDFKRKASPEVLNNGFVKKQVETMEKIITQKKEDKNKIYSLHEPGVECIAKGKVHKKYEFGCKVAIACTAKECFIIDSQAIHGNPYDGHTLEESVKRAQKNTNHAIEVAIADKGYKGVSLEKIKTLLSGNKELSKEEKRLVSRRQAIEPIIGHCKREHRLGINRLKKIIGDVTNSVFSAIGYNLKAILNAITNKLAQCKPTFS